MIGNWIIDNRLIEKAQKEESAQIVEGTTDEGVKALLIVVTGANVGILKKAAESILPALKKVGKK